MYGLYKNLPENIKKFVKALLGISYNDWLKLKMVLDTSFEKKRREAEQEISISSEEDIYNPF